jgi:hypothetical protein
VFVTANPIHTFTHYILHIRLTLSSHSGACVVWVSHPKCVLLDLSISHSLLLYTSSSSSSSSTVSLFIYACWLNSPEVNYKVSTN